jgi:hypothetical protein
MDRDDALVPFIRLTHPQGGAVVIELPMAAADVGAALAALGRLGFELQRTHQAGPRELDRLYDASLRLPEDLAAIVRAAGDLAMYRTAGPVADDLARSVAFELEDRARRLPERLDE